MLKTEKSKLGKSSRILGKAFELKVRASLEKDGWIVMRNMNDVEWPESNIEHPPEERIGIFKQAKPKFVFNPIIKRRIMLGMQSGFPDFICMKSDNKGIDFSIINEFSKKHEFEVKFVECKMNGYLDREEKDKAAWIMENLKIPVFIASKGKLRGEIIMEEFEVKK